MIDVRKNALQMLEDGMSLKAAAACSGTTKAQIREWCDEDYEKRRKNPVLALMHRGMTCAEIVAEMVDTADLEVVDECDDPSYECVAVEAQIVKDDEPFGFYSRAGNATIYLHPTDHEQDNLCFAVKLVKWDFNEGYVMKFEAEPTLPSLAHMNDFECYLMALSQAHVELIGCERDLDDEVEPNDKPEYELV